MQFKYGFSVMKCTNTTYITDASRNHRPIYCPIGLESEPNDIYTYVPGIGGAFCFKSRGSYKLIGTWNFEKKLFDDFESSENIIIINNSTGEDIKKYFSRSALGQYYGLNVDVDTLSRINPVEHLHSIAINLHNSVDK